VLAGHRRQRRILAAAHRHGSRSRLAGAAHGGLQTGVATGCLEYNPGNAYSTLPLILRGPRHRRHTRGLAIPATGNAEALPWLPR